jgi:hypothetical protein
MHTLTKSGAGRAYHERGWPTYESCVARILKSRHQLLWDPVLDVGEPVREALERVGDQARSLLPPLSIAEFGAAVGDLHFTNGADRDVVSAIYERTLRTAFGGATRLLFRNCGWEAAAAASFGASLELCTRLEELNLMDNPLGDAGVCALADALREGACPALEELRLYTTKAGDGGLKAIGRELDRGALPKLKRIDYDGNSLLGDAGVCAFADELREGGWPVLEELILNRTEAGDGGLKALGRALGRGALPKLKVIGYFGNSATAEGEDAVAAARPGVEVRLNSVS